MPDMHHPPKWRRPIRAGRGIAYLLLSAAGLSALLFTPTTIEDRIGGFMTTVWGVLTISGMILSLCGVIAHRYRWEWVSMWLAIGGITIYLFTLWPMVADGEMGRLTQALLVTAVGGARPGTFRAC